MTKFKAWLRLLGAVILHLVAFACFLNILFISTRPETISVVNAAIGLGVLGIAALAMGRIQWRKGRAALAASIQENSPGSGS